MRRTHRTPTSSSRRRPATCGLDALRPAAAAAAAPLAEPLEARRLFSVTAVFAHGTLAVFGDNLANTITVSRADHGRLLVNGGAVRVLGKRPTVTNTALISITGLGGNDTLSLDETNGPLPPSALFGGSGVDTLTGGSASDRLAKTSPDGERPTRIGVRVDPARGRGIPVHGSSAPGHWCLTEKCLRSLVRVQLHGGSGRHYR